jgi:hypothetical protein
LNLHSQHIENIDPSEPTVLPDNAREIAEEYVNGKITPAPPRLEYFVMKGPLAVLTFIFLVDGKGNAERNTGPGLWEIFVEAQAGTVVRAAQRN